MNSRNAGRDVLRAATARGTGMFLPNGTNMTNGSQQGTKEKEEEISPAEDLMREARSCILTLRITRPSRAFSQILSTRSIAKVGDQVPEFTLSDFGGKNFSLSGTLTSQSALLWFTNLCQDCQTKLDEVRLGAPLTPRC